MDEDEYTIEAVTSPLPIVKRSSAVYSKIINDVSKRPSGIYKITVPSKKTSTLYQALAKLVRSRTDVKLHKVSGIVYLEKIDKPFKK
ncbi:MAG: GspE family protein [Candidatus Bathyarchaeota archaeon]|nr:GspE family protein [Candidatus Bathyarchaeota archaeon]